jgi:hypothetical protein
MIGSETQLVYLLGLATVFFLCGFWLLPGGVLALRRRANGEMQVDVRAGYSPATLYRLLHSYGPEGRASFKRMLVADMVFPAVYAAFLVTLADLAAASNPASNNAASAARVAAIAAAGWDYIENGLLLFVLHRFPACQSAAARLAGLSTSAKMLSFMIALGSLAAVYPGLSHDRLA